MIDLTQERDVETLRQISLLLERENQRLLAKTQQLIAENARLRGLPDPEQLALAALQALWNSGGWRRCPHPRRPRPPRDRHGRHVRDTDRDRSLPCLSWRSGTNCPRSTRLSRVRR